MWGYVSLVKSRTWVVAAALTMLAVSSVAPGEAALPGRNGPLAAFVELESREGTYGTLEFFGGAPSAKWVECLESDDTGDDETPCPRNPAFAPGSARVAYELGGRLVVGTLAQKKRRVLAKLTERDGDPAWTPDGERLVFAGRRSGKPGIYSVRTDGGDLRGPLATPGRAPTVSSRGQVAYVAGGSIHVLNLLSGATRKLARGEFPDWSPSGRTLIFQRRSATYLGPASKPGQVRLLSRRARRAVFSPDGKRIAFLRVARGDQTGRYADYSVFSADLNGGRTRLLRRGGEVDTGSEFNSYQEIAWGGRRR